MNTSDSVHSRTKVSETVHIHEQEAKIRLVLMTTWNHWRTCKQFFLYD